MKRRDFLKILGVAPMVASVPVLAKAAISEGQASDFEHVAETARLTDAADISNNALNFIGEMNKSIAQTGEVMIDNAGSIWPAEWGNKRITAKGAYERGHIVVSADGKIHRAVKKA